MKWLKFAFDFYINASIHVALAVYSFIRITELYFDLPYNEPLNYFVFYGTITGYNFIKYAGVAKFHHRSLTTHLKFIQLFSLICFMLMSYYAIQLKYETLLFLLPFGLLTLLYAVPFLRGFRKNLRSLSFTKIIIVAIVWAGVTVLIPLFDVGKELLDYSTLILLLQRFIFVIVLMFPFEIRDMKYDAISLETIPRKIGVKQTKKLGFVLLLLCLFLEFLISNESAFRISFFIIFVLLSILLMRATENQKKYYSSFIVESIPIVWLLLLTFLK